MSAQTNGHSRFSDSLTSQAEVENMNSHVCVEDSVNLSANQIYAKFKYLYQRYILIAGDDLMSIYDDDVVFKDPVHSLQGLTVLQDYFAKVSGNLLSCEFEFIDEMLTESAAHITWHMHFKHPKINSGVMTTLRGMSYIRFGSEGKIIYHEDAYDLGAMLYEHLPVLGRFTKWLKGRLGQ